VLKSFVKLGKDKGFIKNLIDTKYSYEELKKIKYLEKCINKVIFNKAKISYEPYLPTSGMREIFDDYVLAKAAAPSYPDKRDYVLGEAFKNKLSPEQIAFICNMYINSNVDDMQEIHNGFLKGFSVEEMWRVIETYRDPYNIIPLKVLIEDELEIKESMKKIQGGNVVKENER
jgi:hypothetical protein